MVIPAITYPLLAMVFITIVVMITMYRRRIRYMKHHRIHPEKVSNRAAGAEYLKDTRASDNYMNLFELPILFYLAVIVMMVLNIDSRLLVALSWAFVAFRAAHSFIHCTYNRVMHRFGAFILGVITLISIWLIMAVELLFEIRL